MIHHIICIVPEIWSAKDITFCHSGLLLPFNPSMDPENQNFEKMQITPEDIIILQICTISDSHMMYGS